MKILLLSPNQIERYNWTHQLFRNEIGRQHDVLYYGEGYPNYIPGKPVPEIIKGKDFDLILTYGLKYTEPFIGIGDINIPKAHIAVDYFPDSTSGTYDRNHKMFKRDKYDLYFGVVGDIVRNLERNKICTKAHLLPFSIDTNIYQKINCDKTNDVLAVFTTNDKTYPFRTKIKKMVSSLKDLKTYTGKVQHRTYIKMINQSKLCITSNNKFKSLSIKYSEVLACGSFLLADLPEDFNELGYLNGLHLILYSGINDLKDKIYFYLKHSNTREQIAQQGMEFVRKNHNNQIRVQQMTEIIKKEIGIK